MTIAETDSARRHLAGARTIGIEPVRAIAGDVRIRVNRADVDLDEGAFRNRHASAGVVQLGTFASA